MANEIDLYRDLKVAELGYKLAKKRKDKAAISFWIDAIKYEVNEIKQQYPDLILEELEEGERDPRLNTEATEEEIHDYLISGEELQK